MVLSSVRCVLPKFDSLPRSSRDLRARFVRFDRALAGSGPSAGRPRSGRYPALFVVERVLPRDSARKRLGLRSPAMAAGPAAWLRGVVGDASRTGGGKLSGAAVLDRSWPPIHVSTFCRITPRVKRTHEPASTAVGCESSRFRAPVGVGIERRLRAKRSAASRKRAVMTNVERTLHSETGGLSGYRD